MTVKMDKAIVNGKIKYSIDAKSGEIGDCFYNCGKIVRARCGKINTEHWAHIETESLYDIESHNDWHVSWKKFFEKRGYMTEKRFGNFIADAYNPKTNTVVEYQHSSITPQEIIDRCKHHKSENRNVIWILDYTKEYKDGRVKLTKKIRNRNEFYSFGIKWQTKSYIEGLFTFNEEVGIPNVLTFFNIISNYDDNNYVPLEIFKENTEEPSNVSYDIDKHKFVLLKIKKTYKKGDDDIGKYGYGDLVFM